MKAGHERTIRTVITGVGVVSPIGCGSDVYWSNLLAGCSGVRKSPPFGRPDLPCRLAAEVRDFDSHRLLARRRKFLKVMPRAVQFGVAASVLAMEDAGLRRGDLDPERLGVIFGAGRMSTTPDELIPIASVCTSDDGGFDPNCWGTEALSQIAPLWLLRQLPNMPAAHVSIEYDAQGPNNTITSRDASALLALAEAVNAVERGAADCLIVGGCGSLLAAVDWVKLSLFEELSPTACRPFDRNRDGTVLGEGAAAFVVERRDHAQRRGAGIYAEILGIGAGCDGTGRDGVGLKRAVSAALRQAGLEPGGLGHVNAHGKGTRIDDHLEAQALGHIFGEATVPITALKGGLGHSDAGSGAMELAASLLSLRHGTVPATLNHASGDAGCRLAIVREPVAARHPTALCVNRTSQGQSAAVILRAA